MSREALMKRLVQADPAIGVTPDPHATEALLRRVISTSAPSTTPADDEPVTGLSRHRWGRWSGARRFGWLAAAAVIAIGVVLAVGFSRGGLGSSDASAAQVLRAAATATEARPARLPGPDEFIFVRWLARFLEPIRANVNLPLSRTDSSAPKARVTIEAWDSYSTTRVGESEWRVLSVSFPTAAARRRWAALGHPNLRPRVGGLVKIEPSAFVALGHHTLTLHELLALPDNPRTLYRRLFAGGTPSQALDDVNASFELYPIGPKVRAAIYRALALVPDIHVGGRARSLTGQVGEAIWAPTGAPPNANRDELIIDPHTGGILGTQIIITSPGREGLPGSEGLPVGTIYSQSAVLQQTVTNTPGPPTS